jgi:hypothetical protein
MGLLGDRPADFAPGGLDERGGLVAAKGREGAGEDEGFARGGGARGPGGGKVGGGFQPGLAQALQEALVAGLREPLGKAGGDNRPDLLGPLQLRRVGRRRRQRVERAELPRH